LVMMTGERSGGRSTRRKYAGNLQGSQGREVWTMRGTWSFWNSLGPGMSILG
jgi:hypothetical protein